MQALPAALLRSCLTLLSLYRIQTKREGTDQMKTDIEKKCGTCMYSHICGGLTAT